MAVTTPIPPLISNPLPNIPKEVQRKDMEELWTAVQLLQATTNHLIQHQHELEGS
jgi:hypothetical protein